MKVSLNTVRQFTNVDIGVDELVEKINQQLGGVEEVVDLGVRYKGAVIAKVVECEKHPNADKLSVCKIDAGDGQLVQVVCGAPNVRAGIFVVWLGPGVTVPSSFDDKEPFVLGARELRGVISNGMLASPKELALGDSHDGILEITEADLQKGKSLAVGQDFAELFGLDDTIIDIENKMFTHRPDCFGQLGVAREIAGILHQPFTSPDWYNTLPEFTSGEGLALTVKNEAHEAVPRFMAVAIRDVTVKPSPVWLQAALVRMGGKPINNIVDITNYVMLMTAQPTHAYDYDKLRGKTLGARMAHDGEKITLLNHKSYTLTAGDIVIVDGEGPVGLAGIMGGGDSEVSNETKNVVLEVANFDMYTLRRSSMNHGVFTDALTRFNKGQSPLQNPYVLDLLMSSLMDVAGGTMASHIFDDSADHKGHGAIAIDVSFINDRLGLTLSVEQISALLTNVEFQVETSVNTLRITPPYWRTDIDLPEDIVEEVGRLYGFDQLPRELPRRSVTPPRKNPNRVLKQRIREALTRAGANELLTYSFVHEKTLKSAGQDASEAFKLSNALSPDLQFYRLSVLPSLLEKVHPNIKSGHDEFVLFEIGKGHNVHNMRDELPVETDLIELVYASKKPQDGASFYRARRYVEQLSNELGLSATFASITDPLPYAGMAPYDQSRSALVMVDDTVIGIVGELKSQVRKAFKLPEYVSAATLDLASIGSVLRSTNKYSPLSRYPGTWQDICFKVSADVTYQQLLDSIATSIEGVDVDVSVSPVDIYRADDTTDRQLTFRISLTDHNQTIQNDTVTSIINQVIKKAQQDCGAVVV